MNNQELRKENSLEDSSCKDIKMGNKIIKPISSLFLLLLWDRIDEVLVGL